MAKADSGLIQWLFHESGITRALISKETGIAESTLSRIASGVTDIHAIRFGHALKLTEYARFLQQPKCRPPESFDPMNIALKTGHDTGLRTFHGNIESDTGLDTDRGETDNE